jgi:hypothetical protein
MVISEEGGRALYGACNKRGPDKGRLLRNPPKDRLARAAWYGAQSVCNPYKLSISALLFMPDDERAIYREIEKLFDDLKAAGMRPELMDRDRRVLESLGAW